jgi:uncharacterized protein (DUF1778 family)
MSTTANESRLTFQIAPDLKLTIERAAAQLGQSVNDFAISTLVETAQTVIGEESVTELSARDRDLFVSLLDDEEREPNAALKRAAQRYRKQVGRRKSSPSRPAKSRTPRPKTPSVRRRKPRG